MIYIKKSKTNNNKKETSNGDDKIKQKNTNIDVEIP